MAGGAGVIIKNLIILINIMVYYFLAVFLLSCMLFTAAAISTNKDNFKDNLSFLFWSLLTLWVVIPVFIRVAQTIAPTIAAFLVSLV